MSSQIPLVSVIVHTKNSGRTIHRHIQSILKQSYKNIEIVAVDNFSTDKTPLVLRKHAHQFYSKGPERSAQRNYGVKKAHGKYVYIVDSDMILTKEVIAEAVQTMQSDEQMGGLVVPEKSIGRGYWTKCKALERACYERDPQIEAARFFSKKVFQEFGGYDEKITGPEDWDLPQRIKRTYKIGRIESYVLHDEGTLTLFGTAKKKYYYAKKASVYLSKHKRNITLSQTIYFLRPAFYRNWKLLIKKFPITIGMIIMLGTEQLAGIYGVVYAKLQK